MVRGSGSRCHATRMDFGRLAETIRKWEEDGSLRPGEAIVVGLHEPNPQPGALLVGAVNDDFLVQVLDDTGGWNLLRRYESEEEAADFAFHRLGRLDAQRYWGDEEWSRIRDNVRRGSILRTAALLLIPEWDIGHDLDRWELVRRLQVFGVEPLDHYWVEGVDGLPQPGELVLQMRRGSGGEWVIGNTERGSFHETGRFSVEAHACQFMLRQIVMREVTTMGTKPERAHILPKYQALVRRALTEALGFVIEGG